MEFQQGVLAGESGRPFKLSANLSRPRPREGQVLVKSQLLALTPANQVRSQEGSEQDGEAAAAHIGRAAFCGIVMRTGGICSKLKIGDHVFGLCRLEENAHSPFQETFVVDEDLVFKKPENLTPEDAASTAIGLMTAAFGVIVGGKLTLPKAGSKAKEREAWVIVLGGSSAVGQYAIQLGRLCGYQVAASCSPSEASTLMTRGATIAFNNRASLKDQVAEARAITDGSFALVFDASGMSHDIGMDTLKQSTEKKAFFSAAADKILFYNHIPLSRYIEQHATNSLSIGVKTPFNGHSVPVGQLSRLEDLDESAAEEMVKVIPILEEHIAEGTITPVEYVVYEGTGWKRLNEAMAFEDVGKRNKCIIVRVQD